MAYRILILTFFKDLIITILIESITIYIVTKNLSKILKNQTYVISDIKSFIILGIIPSILTLPYFLFVWPFFISDRILYIISGEIIIVIIEALLLKLFSQYHWKICVLLSICANFNSFLLGNLVKNMLKVLL